MEKHGGLILIGKTPDLSSRAFWQTYHQCHLAAKQEDLVKEVMNFALQNIFHNSNDFLKS
jgi:hypothetical protein